MSEPREFLARLRALADAYETAIAADERGESADLAEADALTVAAVRMAIELTDDAHDRVLCALEDDGAAPGEGEDVTDLRDAARDHLGELADAICDALGLDPDGDDDE